MPARRTELTTVSDRAWQHPWLSVERLIRAICETRWDKATRPKAKAMFKRAIEERTRIRRAGWMN